MTIDEAIAHAREKAKDQRYYANFEKNTLMYRSCVKRAEEHEQLAEWLEELKALRHDAHQWAKAGYAHGHSVGYNKAIDDYMNKLCDRCIQQPNECCKSECPFCTDGCDIVNTGELLKERVKA